MLKKILILIITINSLTTTSCSILKKKQKQIEKQETTIDREVRELIDTQVVVPEISLKDTLHFNNDTVINLEKDGVKVKIDYKKKGNKIILDVSKPVTVIPIKMDRITKESIKQKTETKVIDKEKKTTNYIPIVVLVILGIIIFFLLRYFKVI